MPERTTPSAPNSQVRVVDWLMEALFEHGVSHAFMVPGGGAMHLNDAVGLNDAIEPVCVLHEQAAAIAAEAYTKASGRLALCLVTSGPGGTNAITGVAGGWLDSTPMFIVSGQVKRADLVGTTRVRQRGVQELDMSALVTSITKYAAMVDQPESIRFHFEKALHLATSGRPGPVWLEIPLDVQGAMIDPAALQGFEPEESEGQATLDPPGLARVVDQVAEMLQQSNRPLVLVGSGVRIAGADEDVLTLIEALGVPVMTTWPAMGIVGEDHPLYVGRPGPGGSWGQLCASERGLPALPRRSAGHGDDGV